MAEKSTDEIICAFAAGCMDKNNFVHLKEYMRDDKDLPYEDLGELQNIMAMIPIILEVEVPDPSLKSKVAKKLLEITDEIKSKKKAEKKRITTEKSEVKPENKPLHQTSERITHVPTAGNKRAEDDLLIKKNREEEVFPEKQIRTTIPPPKKEEDKKTTTSGPKAIFVYLLFGFLLIALAAATYFLNETNNELEYRLTEMRVELQSLQQDFISSQRFINNYMSLIEFFHYNDIAVVNFENSDSSQAAGKLFLSFEEREALIQVHNVPQLPPDEVFELWFVSKGVSISMGVFKPQINQTYIKIPYFPSVPKEDIDLFRITIEPTTGSDTPSGELVLFGSLVNEKPPEPVKRRRW